jgi:hypothetical protein
VRQRVAGLIIEDVTLNRTDQIHLHVQFRGGQTIRLTLALPAPVGALRNTPAEPIAPRRHTEGVREEVWLRT